MSLLRGEKRTDREKDMYNKDRGWRRTYEKILLLGVCNEKRSLPVLPERSALNGVRGLKQN